MQTESPRRRRLSSATAASGGGTDGSHQGPLCKAHPPPLYNANEDATTSSFAFELQFLDTESMRHQGKRRDATFWATPQPVDEDSRMRGVT